MPPVHRDERAKELYLHTLERMARGGMYDQLAVDSIAIHR